MTVRVIEGSGLVRRYATPRQWPWGSRAETRAVDGVDIRINAGEIVGLIGESGSGKSTIGRLLLGLEAPDVGTVRVDGTAMPPRHAPQWRSLRRDIQMIFQDPHSALDPRARILDQVAEPLDIFDIGAPESRRERAADALAEVGLNTAVLDQFPSALSGGQKQRVVIARALVLRPRFLVCDEPVSALDVSVGAQIVELLATVQRQHGMSLLVVSHDLSLVRSLVNRVCVVYAGRIVEKAATDDLFRHPRHPYTRLLIDSVPVADPRRRKRRARAQGLASEPSASDHGCAFAPRCSRRLPVCTQEAPQLKVAGAHFAACHNPAPVEETK